MDFLRRDDVALLPKDYLSINDVADYFNDLGHDYDLSVTRDCYLLNKDIYDLILQNKITAVFHFSDYSKFHTVYYCLQHTDAYKLFIQNDAYIDVMFYSRVYCYDNGMKPDLSESGKYIIDNSHYITLEDIYIPKIELDNLFNQDADIKQQLADAKATIDRLQAENEQLRQAQTSQPSDDKELAYNSQTSVAKMLYGILTEHDYDLTKHKGTANELIVSACNSHGTPVTKNFVADWIKRANQAKIDSLNK